MIKIAVLVAALLLSTSALVRAEFPYPANPRPCAGSNSAGCVDATAFAQYLFLPETTPPTRPSDFNNDWKVTSDKTGEAEIDSNPQELFGVKGASVDLAWQVTTGRPDVVIAVLDSGIKWQSGLPDLVNKFYLNRRELPVPQASTNPADAWDRNGDGVFNVADYLADSTHAADARVSDQNGNGMIDPEDLIFLFSDGVDDDANGYVDDISGWDFFEDDNDALDEVNYGHGTGEAHDSTAEANNGRDVGTCPNCMTLMVRVGDSFVADVNAFGRGVLYAVDNGASLIQEALGTLNNSSFAQKAIDYAYARGVVVIASAADEESNHHNYPANYAHTVLVNSITKFAELSGIIMTPHSYLYLNGCTNYTPHVSVSVPSSSCSSEATGKGSGIAGLVYSAARNEVDRGHLTRYPNGDGTFSSYVLSAEEVRQLLTQTADDVNFDARPEEGLPQNYEVHADFPVVTHQQRYPSIAGFDQYFGYGRVNADSAVRRVAAGRIPPEAAIASPGWFQTIDPLMGSIEIRGRVAARRAQHYSVQVTVAPGVQPPESAFEPLPYATLEHQTTDLEGVLAQIPLAALAARMPHGVEGPATDEQGKPDPERFTFTVRVRVTDNLGNVGEDRRALYLHHDADLITSVPVYMGTDGAASPSFADITGDGVEELIVATSDGFIHAYQGRSLQEAPGWPVHSDAMEIETESPAFRTQSVAVPFTPFLASPTVGDLDRNGSLEVVAADLYGKVYVWSAAGEVRPGFPVRTKAEYSTSLRSERDLSTPEGRVPDRTNRHDSNNRTARGFGGGPALGNLDNSADGSLEIIAGATDRHVYAWYNDGRPVPGWPVLVKDPTKVDHVDPITNEVFLKSNAKARLGTKITTPPSLGDIDGDGTLDVVLGVNEEYLERPNAVFNNQIVQFLQLAGALQSGNGRVYALHADGAMHGANGLTEGWNPDAFLPGWPVHVAMLTTELLPTVGTGINGSPALADLDKDGKPEIATFAFLGPAYIFNGLGESFLGEVRRDTPRTLEADVFGGLSNSVDMPAYPSLGGGILVEMLGAGSGFQFIAPTIGLGKSLDTNFPAQQMPADLQVGIWDVATADGMPTLAPFRPAFPRLVNDLQFLTAPSSADIDGDGHAESISGSGVFDVHAFSADGSEPAGWPKFTGGWTINTPASGDLDADGKLEVAGLTREGYLFIWRTSGPECGYIPWRQYHHDEWSTGNYATDARPPAALQGTLTAVAGGAELFVHDLPGDDIYCGTTANLQIRYARQPITDASFAAADAFVVSNVPLQGGRMRNAVLRLTPALPVLGSVYVAARTLDDAGNPSRLSQLGQVVLTTAPTATASPSATAIPTSTSSPTRTTTLTQTPVPSFTPTEVPPSPTAPASPTNTTAPRIVEAGGCAVAAPTQDGAAGGWLMALAIGIAGVTRRRRCLK